MTESMSDDAQQARARKARQRLSNLLATGYNIASDTKEAMQPEDREPMQPEDREPVARVHVDDTPVNAAEPRIDRRTKVLDEALLRPKDSPVDLFATAGKKSAMADLQTQNVDDLRQLLATANERIMALEAEVRGLRFSLQDLSSGATPERIVANRPLPSDHNEPAPFRQLRGRRDE